MSARTVTFVIKFDDPIIGNAPKELVKYLYGDGTAVDGVLCHSIQEGDQIKRVAELESEVESLEQDEVDTDELASEGQAELVKLLHRERTLFNKSAEDVLDDLFRKHCLHSAVAA